MANTIVSKSLNLWLMLNPEYPFLLHTRVLHGRQYYDFILILAAYVLRIVLHHWCCFSQCQLKYVE